MIYGYIGAALAVGILIGVIALAIKWMSKKVTDSINHKTVELISSYEELLGKKSEELNSIKKRTPAEITVNVPDRQGNDSKHDDTLILNYAELMNSSTYLGTDYGSVYKKIRDGFAKDPNEAIAEHVTPVYENGPATELINSLDYDTVYRLSLLDKDEQYKLLSENLYGNQKDILEYYVGQHPRFSIIDFYDFLQKLAVNEPHKAKLYVSGRDADKSYPSSVDVVINDDICEGFQLEADNRMYEYSIKEREIV